MNIIVQCSLLIVLFDSVLTQQDAVTCSSTFKLVNQQSGDRLHSHEVKYGSGSGQQVDSIIFLRSSNFSSLFKLFFALVCDRLAECRRCEQLLASSRWKLWARVCQQERSSNYIIISMSNRVPIKCDSIVRLIHIATRRYLHSHDFASPLSHNQEVSAFGENGVSDEGDRWKVVCTSRNDYWLRKDGIRLQHVTTGK